MMLIFPRQKAIVKTFVLPTAKTGEIRQMTMLQAARCTPLEKDEMRIGYRVAEVMPGGFSRVEATLVRQDDVEEFLGPWKAAGQYPARLVVDTFDKWEDETLNLLSPEEIRDGTRVLRRREGLRRLGLFILLCGLTACTLLLKWHMKKKQLFDLTQRSAALEPKTQELKRMESVLQSLKKQMNAKGSFLQAIAELSRLAPASVSLRRMRFESGRSLSIDGSAFTLTQAVQLMEALQRSPIFSKVEMRSSHIQAVNNREIVEFSLLCHAKTKS